MMRGDEPAPEPEPEQNTEPSENEQVVAALFGRLEAKCAADRRFLESLHRPYTRDDAA